MLIKEINVIPVRVPLSIPAKWSGGTRNAAPALLVKIHTDEGITGIGECVGPTLPVVQTVIERELSQFLIGIDPSRIEFILHRMEEFTVNWSQIAAYAISGIEMALLDIKGKTLNTPVANLLGGIYRDQIDYIGYIFIDTPEKNAAEAVKYVQQGFKTLKVKVGRSIDMDTQRVKAIREAVGSEAKIRIDANMNWSRSTAIRAIKSMQEFGLEYVEQPIPYYDIDGMAQVSKAVDVPIAADESCATVRDAIKLIENEACEVFVIYISEAGGISKAKQMAGLADAADMTCVLGTWAELGVGTIAGAHLIASSRNFHIANDTHYPMQEDDILTELLQFKDGKLVLPDGPGLGVELDEEKVQKYSQLSMRESVFYDPDDPEFIPRIGQIL